MNFDGWSEVFGATLLEGRPDRPTYFSMTEAELRHLNDVHQLGITDPVEDLKVALSPVSFSTFTNRHNQWEGSKTKEPPPWLPFLAASTVVVDRETELGSLSFYQPLSDFLNVSKRISEESYRPTFFRWWRALARWLLDADRHAGALGFPTWESIPPAGPRSVIGHPYTQVLLRPDERRQIDDFLAEFDHQEGEYPTARDRHKAAKQLVDSLRRWAGERRAISNRLRRLLESGSEREVDSLGYILLGRLFAETSQDRQQLGVSSRAVQLVPAYDEYERVLHLTAVAPSWVDPSTPLSIEGAEDVLRRPGDAALFDLPITASLLTEGVVVDHQVQLRLIGRSYYLLAARDWALWCGVDGASADEEIYVLLEIGQAVRLGLRTTTAVGGLPDGWGLHGPTTLAQLPDRLAEHATLVSRQLLPRLTGGLKLQSGLFLCGGEPTLELAGFEGTVAVDDAHVVADGSTVLVAPLDLTEGHHVIEVGGFELRFETTRSLRPVEVHPQLGRDASGSVVPFPSDRDLLVGARMYPSEDDPVHRGLIPRVDLFIKFGEPGEIGVVDGPRMADWAVRLGLPHVGVEVYARSTHPHRDRLIALPRWIAWEEPGGRWTIGELLGAGERDESARYDPQAWRSLCDQIGADPNVWGQQADQVEEIVGRWREYCKSGSDQ